MSFMLRRPSNEAGTLLFARPNSKEPNSISRSEQAGLSFKHSLKEVSNNVMDMLSKWSLVKRELRLGNATRAADGTSSVEQVLEPKRAMRSEAELREMQSSTLCEEAEHVQQLREIDGDKTIERQLGDMMRAQEWTTSDMIKAWDKNGDMQIQKMEFRVAIKNQMGNDANHVQIDALFERLDVDSGGSLDEQELRKSIKLMYDTSLAASHQRANTVAHLAYCQERLEQIERCSKPTMAAEAARERHRVLCEAPPLEARVGQVLLALETAKPPVSSAEVAAHWDSDGGGRIGKASFVKVIKGYKNLGRLRVDGSNSEVEEQLNRLYESLGERLGAGALPITATIEAMKAAAKEVPMKVSEAAEVGRPRIHIPHACACAIPSYASSQSYKSSCISWPTCCTHVWRGSPPNACSGFCYVGGTSSRSAGYIERSGHCREDQMGRRAHAGAEGARRDREGQGGAAKATGGQSTSACGGGGGGGEREAGDARGEEGGGGSAEADERAPQRQR